MKKRPEQIVNADTEEGQAMGEVLVEVVEEQLRNDDPPIVRETLKRLMKMGESRANAMRYIGSVLSQEIFFIMKHNESFDPERYERALKALPKLPWDDEDDEI